MNIGSWQRIVNTNKSILRRKNFLRSSSNFSRNEVKSIHSDKKQTTLFKNINQNDYSNVKNMNLISSKTKLSSAISNSSTMMKMQNKNDFKVQIRKISNEEIDDDSEDMMLDDEGESALEENFAGFEFMILGTASASSSPLRFTNSLILRISNLICSC